MGTLKNLDDTLAAKFLAGEATPEEAILVNEWIEASNENKMHFKQLEAVWALGANTHDISPKLSVWHTLQQVLPKKKKPVVYFTAYRIAAAAIITFSVSAAVYFLRPFDSSRQEATWNVKETTNEVASLNLSDGTSVTMNRKSKLMWPLEYAGSEREVKLEGEAFFDVTFNPAKPFIIATDEIKIKVLGTSFNVHDDKAQDLIKTDVTRGKVMMYNSHRSIVIEAGMAGVYNKTSKQFSLYKMPNQNAIGYVTRSLSFSNTTLNDVCVQLKKAYGVQFIFENERLRDCRLTTEYENKSLPFILNVIEESLNIKYRIENDTVFISGDGCL